MNYLETRLNTGSHRNARPEFKPFQCAIWTMGAFFPGSESESTNGRLVFGLPPIGCCSPCLLSSHNGVPLCLLFYSLLSLNPDSAAFSQIPGVRNNMGFYIHFHSAPAPLNQLCVRVSPTFHYIWLKLVYMCFVFM